MQLQMPVDIDSLFTGPRRGLSVNNSTGCLSRAVRAIGINRRQTDPLFAGYFQGKP